MLERLTVAALPLACVLTLAACGGSTGDSAPTRSHAVDSRMVIELFKGQNPRMNLRKYQETSFVDGTVPARAVGYAEDGRLRAMMGCYELVYSMPGDPIETESSMCIYFVKGPEGGGGRLWWNGDPNKLAERMAEHGFES